VIKIKLIAYIVVNQRIMLLLPGSGLIKNHDVFVNLNLYNYIYLSEIRFQLYQIDNLNKKNKNLFYWLNEIWMHDKRL
jgi:hypothetical protein